jgi:flagellar motor switch protein FliG
VLKLLGPREVQKIGHAMATAQVVSRGPRSRLSSTSFTRSSAKHAAVHVDTDSYVRSVLTKALGDDKASNLISRILQGGETSGIEGLKWMDAARWPT